MCLLRRDKGHAHTVRNIGLRLGKRLRPKGISQKPIFSLTARTRKNCLLREQFPSLHSKCVAGTVLLKTDLLLSRVVDLSPGLCSTLLLQQSATLCVICALLLVFNKSLRTSSSIGPLLSCVVHRLIFSCRSPIPSAVFLLRSRAV